MRFQLNFILPLMFGLMTVPAGAAHTKASLLLFTDTARPGDTVLAGVQLRMDPNWHTYWTNHGAAGLETRIQWSLPEGVTAGPIQWPVPEKFPPIDITTYGYKDEVVLLVPLNLSANISPGPHPLKAKVSWLECEQSCIPGNAEISASLIVGAESTPSTNAGLLRAWQEKLPRTGKDLAARAWWEGPATGDSRKLILEWRPSTSAVTEADFYPLDGPDAEIQGATERLPDDAGKIRLRKEVKLFQKDWPKTISGLLVEKGGDQHSAFAVSLPITAGQKASAAAPPASTESRSLLAMLLYGFLGGMILNVMPCVFPVIALKILGFVQQSRQAPRQVFRHGLIYSLGVLVSFLIFAGVVIAIQQAGGAATWGMQLQNKWFTLALTAVTLLVALNLFGVFEVNLGGGVMNAAGQLASREGAAGTFFNGMFATLLATPCTAPILAQALGFAFAQKPPVIVVMFSAVALGLAFPYLVLSWRPAWLKFLPRPGAWMEKFKIAMGFPMLATMAWLFSFNAPRFGPGGPLRIGLALVLIAAGVWVWGQFAQRGRRGRPLAFVFGLALVVSAVALAFTRDSEQWQKWSPEAVAQARREGRPVLVDFTADWCLTCKVNKSVALDVSDVQAKLKAINAVLLVGDNTDENPAIASELKKFDRAGVPLVLVYPKDPAEAAIVLPALLTPGVVLEALDRAVH